jgi:hypothetical protein
MLHLRPNNRFEDLEGMYLVGGGTHPGSGLPVIFESAKISSRLLLDDMGISGATSPAESSEPFAGSVNAPAARPDLVEAFSRLFGLRPAKLNSFTGAPKSKTPVGL